MFFFKLLFAHRKTSWILFLVAFGLLLYGLFAPRVDVGVNVSNLDKVVHFGGFFIVFLLGRFATHNWIGPIYWLLPFISALLLEYLQGQWVLTRDFSYLDMLANLLGVGAASLLWIGLLKVAQFEEEDSTG